MHKILFPWMKKKVVSQQHPTQEEQAEEISTQVQETESESQTEPQIEAQTEAQIAGAEAVFETAETAGEMPQVAAAEAIEPEEPKMETLLSPTNDEKGFAIKKVISVEGFVTLGVVLAIFIPIGVLMGFDNMLKTLFANAWDLLLNTCFYLMGVAVVIGALSAVLTEFGVIALANKALSPLMKPLYGMPGATSVAIFSSFLSDNPAVLSLADDVRYRRYFKKYQLAGLTNLGTAFGMGLIVIITLAGKGVAANSKGEIGSVALAVAMGVVGAIIGSIVATRLMLRKSKKLYGKDEDATELVDHDFDVLRQREVRKGGRVQRFFDSLLEGGAGGVRIGLAIIPGVLIIANLVMLLTDGQPVGGYTGAGGEGVALLPWVGDKLSIVFKWLFGFETASSISIPITALGSAGAAVSLVGDGVYTANEIAVFTAMCMFWSGYLSTHVAMMDSLGFRKLTTSAILYHTIGGLVAGICANWLYVLFALML